MYCTDPCCGTSTSHLTACMHERFMHSHARTCTHVRTIFASNHRFFQTGPSGSGFGVWSDRRRLISVRHCSLLDFRSLFGQIRSCIRAMVFYLMERTLGSQEISMLYNLLVKMVITLCKHQSHSVQHTLHYCSMVIPVEFDNNSFQSPQESTWNTEHSVGKNIKYPRGTRRKTDTDISLAYQ